MADTDSILDTTKKLLGFESDYTAFDLDIILHINTVFFTLTQLGIGPVTGFSIVDKTANWADFIGAESIHAVKSYMGLRVRLLFDPPATSFVIEAFKKQAEELEWRLNVHMEGVKYPLVITDTTLPIS